MAIQAKLTVGTEDDPYEREAEQTADAVMRVHAGAAVPPPTESGPGPEKRSETSIRARPFAPSRTGGAIASDTAQQVHAVRATTGRALPASERQFFEARFGTSFESVRIHTGSRAHEVASALGAQAFTVGHDVVFGAGQYRPGTRDGRHLIAHELTHVVQQVSSSPWRPSHPIQRSPDGPNAEDLELFGVETRSFEEVWTAFQRAQWGGREEEARALVPTLLAHMGPDEAVEHAIDLGFWLLDHGEDDQARRAFEAFERGLWIRYVSVSGPGVPEFAGGVFGSRSSPEALVERAEALGRADDHDRAQQLFTIAHLFLQMQQIQAAEERADLPPMITEESSLVGAILRQQREQQQELFTRIRNFYPLRAAQARSAGDLSSARELAGIGEELLATLRERSLHAQEEVGPEVRTPVPEAETHVPVAPHPAPTPELREGEAGGSRRVVEEEEREDAEEARPARPRAVTQIIDTPPPFNGTVIMQMTGLRFFHARSRRHAIAGSLGAAVNLAKTLFGVSGAVVTEALTLSERRFVVAGMDPAVSVAAIRASQVPDQPGRLEARGTVFSRAGDDHIVRVVVTADNAVFVPGGELEPVNQEALLQEYLTERRTDIEAGRAAVPRSLVRSRVFAPIDELLDTGDEDDLEAAVDRLSELDATAFSALTWEERARYLQALIDAWTFAAEERAVVEILKTIETRSRFDAVVEQLRDAEVWAQLIDDLDHELWSMLVAVGRRLGEPGPITIEDVARLMIEGRLLRPFPGIAVGPEGPEISVQVLAEIEQAALAFIRFLGSTFDAVVSLITEPDKIVEGLAQLVKLIVMWKLADLGYPPAVEFRARILGQVGQQIVWGFKGLQVLGDRVGQIVSRARWTLIWEIASLFIGVGEVRAVLRGLNLGERTAAFARFLRILGLTDRLTEGTRALRQFDKFARVLRRTSQVLDDDAQVLRLLAHLPEEDVQRLGRVLEGLDIDDTATLARLAEMHPDIGDLARRVLQDVDALGVLVAKAGSLSDEVVRAHRFLRGRGLSAGEVLDIARRIPDGEGARFARAIRAFEEVPTVSRAVLETVAESATRMDAVRTFGAPVYTATFRRAAGQPGVMDDFLASLANRRASMPADDFQRLLDDLAAGDSVRWRRFLGAESHLRRQAPGNAHTLLTSQTYRYPYTWNPTTRRYTRPVPRATTPPTSLQTEVVEVYGDGRIRFWREQPGGTLTDEAVQYNIALHGNQPSPRGATTLQSNHGIQGAWVREHFGSTIEYDDVPAIMLTDSRTGSQHGTISVLQEAEARSRAQSRAGRWDATYWEMRQALIDHHREAGVPEPYIQRLAEESDRVFLPFQSNPEFAHLF